MTDKKWAPIDGFPGYEVSDHGDVRSLPRTQANRWGGRHSIPGRLMKPYIDPNGYCRVFLSHEGKRTNAYVHHLVARAFIPNPLGLPEVNHKHEDGDKSRNNDWNLEWSTRAGNCLHRSRVLKKGVGEKNGRAKVTAEQVAAIRADTRSVREIMKDYPLGRSMIYYIRANQFWMG